jgi:hypothetical protein
MGGKLVNGLLKKEWVVLEVLTFHGLNQ